MVIILKNIAANTKKRDIKDFITPHVRRGMLFNSGDLKGITILKYKNTRSKIIVFHALVEISPDAVAERVIKKLNRKKLCGKHISISRYVVRDPRNDPRHHMSQINNPMKNKRICDRRNVYEEIVSETPYFL